MRNARDSLLPSYRSQVPPYPRSPPAVAGAYPASSSPVRSPSNKKVTKTKTSMSEVASSPGPSMNISAPMNVNPQFAHLVRPDMAHHPSSKRDGSF